MRFLSTLLKFALGMVRLAFKVCVLLVEGAFWTRLVARGAKDVLVDATRGLPALTGAPLECPEGHLFDPEGAVYRCEACGWTYRGSPWTCPNPECSASTSPYTNCPICGLSVRNPARWGRP